MALLNRSRDPVPLSQMRRLPRDGALEIDQAPRFTRGEWRVQRAGWIVMFVVLVLAVTGAFGGAGPLAGATASTAQGLWVQYDRITRHHGNSELVVRVPAAAVSDGEVRLTVNREWLHGQRVESITPEPSDTIASGDSLTYVFPGDGATEVRFSLRPETRGIGALRINVPDAGEIARRQFVYP